MTKSQNINSRHRDVSSEDEMVPSIDNSIPTALKSEGANFFVQGNYPAPIVPVECFISLANDQIMSVEVDSKCTGQEIIVKVCQKLGIVEESAYFGLQYRGKYNEILWLNLRNRLSHQLSFTSPYRLDFRVKYFVQPHTVISEESRHQFYLHAKNRITEGSWSHGVPMSDLYHVIALMTQSDFGNYHHSTSCMKYALFWPKTLNEELSSAGIRETSQFHQSVFDWSSAKCEYELLRLVSDNWLMYGVSFQDVIDCFNQPFKLGVGPEGVYLCSTKYDLVTHHTLDCIQKINCTYKLIELEMLQDNGQTISQKYCLKSSKAAKSFQRYVTETNSFFKCETVDDDIIKNCKNISFFFKKSNSSVNYLYDVMKTSREVYDMARRRAHSLSSNASPTNPDFNVNDYQITKNESSLTSDEQVVDGLRKELEHLRELVQCIVCKDRKINRLFIPCMHIVCCDVCAALLNQCPVCRKPINICHHAYPRWINDDISVSSNKQILCTLPEDQTLTTEAMLGSMVEPFY